MKALNLVTLALLILGGIAWGLVALADYNLIASLFGEGSAISRIVFGLIGLSALWQLAPFGRAIRMDEPLAEGAPHTHSREHAMRSHTVKHR